MDEVDGNESYPFPGKGNCVSETHFHNEKDIDAGCKPTSVEIMAFSLPKRAASNEVKDIAKELARDSVRYSVNNKSLHLPHKLKLQGYAKTLRRTVDEMSLKHEIVFRTMIDKLYVTKENILDRFTNVANEIFSDRQFNWGRIVSVYAFGARLAQYCSEVNMPDYVDIVGDFVGEFIADHLGWWIEKRGGWDAFVEYFPDPHGMEDTIWKGLIFTAVGLGALATMVVAR